jgi:hypothetical protein
MFVEQPGNLPMRSCFTVSFGGMPTAFSASSIYDRHLIFDATRTRKEIRGKFNRIRRKIASVRVMLFTARGME